MKAIRFSLGKSCCGKNFHRVDFGRRGRVPFMEIAQVSLPIESVPPGLYGGTERVVSFLTEELVRQGHDVILYASGDSKTTAKLKPMCKRSLRYDDTCLAPLVHHTVMLQKVFREQKITTLFTSIPTVSIFPWPVSAGLRMSPPCMAAWIFLILNSYTVNFPRCRSSLFQTRNCPIISTMSISPTLRSISFSW